MVSKEPNRLLTGHTNGKSTLADKLPGTMTVRSVLLNRDSPDIESRLKRRRNRTHQVRFKDLEDGSSSSGNSGTGEHNSHRRLAAECDSPHPLRKHSSRASKPWTDRNGPQINALPGKTSVVGAVRGDMASTIEVVAAFLARAPPHPLTPGPTRRCWTPPQTNSLTLPMTRRSSTSTSTSTSTAIQTSPCLKKPQSHSSTHTRSHSLGDSVGMDGDDEHDSQDEYLAPNHVSLRGLKDQSSPPGTVEQNVIEGRSKGSRTDMKSAVAVAKNSRHSCSPSVLHNTEPRHCSSVSYRDGAKRQGSSTPSVVRRRKRMNRTTSDPGKEVSYCTTPTQTESPSPSSAPSNPQLCTTHVQTESPTPPSDSKCSTTQSQTESQHQALPLSEAKGTNQIQTTNCHPSSPNADQSTAHRQTDYSCLPHPTHEPCTTHEQKDSMRDNSSVDVSPISTQIQPECPSPSPSLIQDPPTTQTTTVPYCTSPPPTGAPTQTPEHCAKLPSPPPAKSVCTTPTPPPSTTIPCSTSSAPIVTQHSVPYYTVVSPSATPSTISISTTASTTALSCPPENCTPSVSDIASCVSLAHSTPTPTIAPNATSSNPASNLTPAQNVTHPPSHDASNTMPPTILKPCTFVNQTALSCTSISYYTTTHVPYVNATSPSYATLIQTVSHCNIPCQPLQNNSVGTGITAFSSPVPKLTSCTSPALLVKTLASNVQSCLTPTKTVPLYSSTFRAAPPYTPPSQNHSAQDKRGIRLPPPPPPPPPPYMPRKNDGAVTSGPARRTPMLRADSKVSDKDKGEEKAKKEDVKHTDSPKLCERTSSLKHRAQTPPVVIMKGEKQPSSSPLKVCFKPSCLSSAQAQLGVLHKMLCSGASAKANTPKSQHPLPPSQQGCSGPLGCSVSGDWHAATQEDTLRQVQEIIGGLVSGARCKLDPARVTEKLLSPSGPLHDIRSLQNQLHSLEGVLEMSQNTIKVLLDVIQDLEKKEAERDGHSYRTGQDIENCGTCRDCACIIYSVEHDFRLQEGQVVRTWKVGDPPEGSPQTTTPQPATPQHQDSPPPAQSPAATTAAAATKKTRKKCFWFL
ncbi:mucin-2 isoform X2 [Thalassophryne amazonica]|uniref:mucin-2 isoform X2 n=1 Tax=Thalassophryne amazonica TaxID=390379 RepID=UPI001472648C|nr:mucin-2 isoform X2 [Thalassophryne amazonica]